jgi:hypothetical protein
MPLVALDVISVRLLVSANVVRLCSRVRTATCRSGIEVGLALWRWVPRRSHLAEQGHCRRLALPDGLPPFLDTGTGDRPCVLTLVKSELSFSRLPLFARLEVGYWHPPVGVVAPPLDCHTANRPAILTGFRSSDFRRG